MVLNLLLSLFLMLLTVAMVALFAMMGELSSRVESMNARSTNGDTRTTEEWAAQLDEYQLRSPDAWPDELRHVPELPLSLVVVLSTSCTTCDRFLEGQLGALSPYSPALIISCPTLGRGSNFLKRNLIQEPTWPVYLDPTGEWCRKELGVEVSPAAVLLQHGETVDAFMMSSPDSLATVLYERLNPTAKVPTNGQ